MIQTSISRRNLLKIGALTSISMPFSRVFAAASTDRLVAAYGQTINSLDLHRTGTNRASYQISVNCYDRLVSFGSQTLADGTLSWDYTKIEPALAESWTVSDDGKTLTFKLRKDAIFQDGSKVTAADVKWSFDRAVSVGGFATTQMAAGSLTKPEQFEAIDDETFVIHLPAASKLTLPDLAVPVPMVINSKLAKQHVTDTDPWAMEYLHKNTIGSGAYKVIRWDQGQQVVYERFDGWVCGPKPAIKTVIMREVPSTTTQRALIERGDIQIAYDIPDKDASELSAKTDSKVKVYSTPIDNCIYCLNMNSKFEPFQDANVRKAVAYVVPYEAIFEAAAYKRGAPLWGGPEQVADIKWPQKSPYVTDIAKAKELMAGSKYPDGFETTLSISTDLLWMEPAALLVQEAVAQLGIKVTINKIPGANWRTAALVEKRLPFHFENFGGWLNTPDYYFFWAYVPGHLFNSSNYDNPEMTALATKTLPMAVDNPEYADDIKKMITIAFEDLPRIPLYQPAYNVALNGCEGYEFWYHRMPDLHELKLVGK